MLKPLMKKKKKSALTAELVHKFKLSTKEERGIFPGEQHKGLLSFVFKN